ncbi:hypothetical protein JTB14_028793 [Gonioctena quinquepunctata]|nr:hypothetical protein JTB14_028793 [Gonioctena quinquepunctata]
MYEYCQKNNIFLQAYRSLGGPENRDLIENPTIMDIAKKLNRTTAQVLLRWAIQQNIGVIPKSQTRERIFQNMEVDFTLPSEDMKALSSFKKHIRYDWDPATIT